MSELLSLNPPRLREIIRAKQFDKETSGLARGFTQANLVILSKEYAYDFLLFCQRNPKSCPILDVSEIGSPFLGDTAKGADIRTDIPKYRIYRQGKLVNEPNDIIDEWTEDMVAFLLGCSFTFEQELARNGIPLKNKLGRSNVPMYKTNIPCVKAGIFEGDVVVSMRPIPYESVIRSIQITSRFPGVHGAPLHIGMPEKIGISDLKNPDFGAPVEIDEDEVPVFWACGVTPQAAAIQVKPELMITHVPGHMFITDIKDYELAVL